MQKARRTVPGGLFILRLSLHEQGQTTNLLCDYWLCGN
jgi:hypothetical protein